MTSIFNLSDNDDIDDTPFKKLILMNFKKKRKLHLNKLSIFKTLACVMLELKQPLDKNRFSTLLVCCT